MRRYLIRYALGLVVLVLLLGHAAKVYLLDILSRLDALIDASKLRLIMPQTVDERVVIINIDEKSLAEYVGNLPEVQKNAAGGGHFNPISDFDGIVRRVRMLVESARLARSLVCWRGGVDVSPAKSHRRMFWCPDSVLSANLQCRRWGIILTELVRMAGCTAAMEMKWE